MVEKKDIYSSNKNKCHFDENDLCGRRLLGNFDVKSRISFILDKNSIKRNNKYYDELPNTIKNFLRQLSENYLNSINEKPECSKCEGIFLPIAWSAVTFKIIIDSKEHVRDLAINDLVCRLAKYDSTITRETILGLIDG